MPSPLLISIKKAGLIQYGRFRTNSGIQHTKVSLDLLPSYPQLLTEIASELAHSVDAECYDYILSTFDAIPLATLVCHYLQMPLVYECPSGTAPTSRIIGSYDVGHPTVLLCNTNQNIASLIADAQKVGLVVQAVNGIIDTNSKHPSLAMKMLFTIDDMEPTDL